MIFLGLRNWNYLQSKNPLLSSSGQKLKQLLLLHRVERLFSSKSAVYIYFFHIAATLIVAAYIKLSFYEFLKTNHIDIR